MAHQSTPKLLIVCGDVATRRQLSDVVGNYFAVRSTSDPQQALHSIETDASIAVIVADHAPGNTSGVALLERVRGIRPNVRRVLLAEADDFASLIVGLHSGAIEHLVHKPLNPQTLVQAILPQTAEGAVDDAQRRLSA